MLVPETLRSGFFVFCLFLAFTLLVPVKADNDKYAPRFHISASYYQNGMCSVNVQAGMLQVYDACSYCCWGCGSATDNVFCYSVTYKIYGPNGLAPTYSGGTPTIPPICIGPIPKSSYDVAKTCHDFGGTGEDWATAWATTINSGDTVSAMIWDRDMASGGGCVEAAFNNMGQYYSCWDECSDPNRCSYGEYSCNYRGTTQCASTTSGKPYTHGISITGTAPDTWWYQPFVWSETAIAWQPDPTKKNYWGMHDESGNCRDDEYLWSAVKVNCYGAAGDKCNAAGQCGTGLTCDTAQGVCCPDCSGTTCPADVCDYVTRTFTDYTGAVCSGGSCQCSHTDYVCTGNCEATNSYCTNCASHCGDEVCNCGETYGCSDCGYCEDNIQNSGETCGDGTSSTSANCFPDCGKCQGGTCSANTDCQKLDCGEGTLYCVPQYGATTPIRCCPNSNYRWTGSSCKKNVGLACSSNADCASGYCLTCTLGTCGSPTSTYCCPDPTNCVEGTSPYCAASGSNNVAATHVCRSGTWKKLNGQSCSNGNECDSGLCAAGTCMDAISCISGLEKCSYNIDTSYTITDRYCWKGGCNPAIYNATPIMVSQGPMTNSSDKKTKFKINPANDVAVVFNAKLSSTSQPPATGSVSGVNVYLRGNWSSSTGCLGTPTGLISARIGSGYAFSGTQTEIRNQTINFNSLGRGTNTTACLWPVAEGSWYNITPTGKPTESIRLELCFDSITGGITSVSSSPTGFRQASVTVNYNLGHSASCGAEFGSGQLNTTCTIRETGETATTLISSGSLPIQISDTSRICSGFNVDCFVFDKNFRNINATFTQSGTYNDIGVAIACSADSDCCENMCYSISSVTDPICRSGPLTAVASGTDDRRVVYSREACGFGCMLQEDSDDQFFVDTNAVANKVCFLQSAHVDYDNDGVKEICCGRQWHTSRSGTITSEIQDVSVEPCQVCDTTTRTIVNGNEDGFCEFDGLDCTTGKCHNGQCVSQILGEWKGYECVNPSESPNCCTTCPTGAVACCSGKVDPLGKCTGCNSSGIAVPYDPNLGTCQLYCSNPSASVLIDVTCDGKRPGVCLETDFGGQRSDSYCDNVTNNKQCKFMMCGAYACNSTGTVRCNTDCNKTSQCNDGYVCDVNNKKCVRCGGSLQSSGDASNGLNKCELGCGASAECDENDANTCIQTATKAFTCTSSCKVLDCGNYKCSGNSCLQICSSAANCLKGICTELQCLLEPIPGDVCGRSCSKTDMTAPSALNRTGYCNSTGINFNNTNSPSGSTCQTGKNCCGICMDSNLDTNPDTCSEPVAGKCGITCSTDSGSIGKLDEVGNCKQSGAGAGSYNQLLNEPCRSGKDCCSCVCVLPPCERDMLGKCKSPCIEDAQTHACIPVGFCWEELSEQIKMYEAPGWYFSIIVKPAVSPGVCQR